MEKISVSGTEKSLVGKMSEKTTRMIKAVSMLEEYNGGFFFFLIRFRLQHLNLILPLRETEILKLQW